MKNYAGNTIRVYFPDMFNGGVSSFALQYFNMTASKLCEFNNHFVTSENIDKVCDFLTDHIDFKETYKDMMMNFLAEYFSQILQENEICAYRVVDFVHNINGNAFVVEFQKEDFEAILNYAKGMGYDESKDGNVFTYISTDDIVSDSLTLTRRNMYHSAKGMPSAKEIKRFFADELI